jgi:hypothetical protein
MLWARGCFFREDPGAGSAAGVARARISPDCLPARAGRPVAAPARKALAPSGARPWVRFLKCALCRRQEDNLRRPRGAAFLFVPAISPGFASFLAMLPPGVEIELNREPFDAVRRRSALVFQVRHFNATYRALGRDWKRI